MPVPEPLVTIRTYDSPQLAEADAHMLADAGFNPYVAGSYFRSRMQSELRVPESQARAALEYLPPTLPTLTDHLNRVTAHCARCGAEGVHVTTPATEYILCAGAGLAVWALLRGEANAAIGIMFAAVAAAVPVRALTRHYRCDACGHTWRRREGAEIRPFPREPGESG